MPKAKKTPGSELKSLIEKHGLNCNRLAHAINMTTTMIRLITLDKTPVSPSAALRLSKFFKTKPEEWLNLQVQYDLEKAAKNPELSKALASITDINRYVYSRKPHEKKSAASDEKKKETAKPKRKKTEK